MKNYCYAILVFFALQGVSFLCQSNILGLRVRCSLFFNLSCQSSLKMDSNLSFYLNAIYYFEITKPSTNMILTWLQALAKPLTNILSVYLLLSLWPRSAWSVFTDQLTFVRAWPLTFHLFNRLWPALFTYSFSSCNLSLWPFYFNFLYTWILF